MPRMLLETDTPYDILVQVMDTRAHLVEQRQNDQLVQAELFPDISIGDAPETDRAAASGNAMSMSSRARRMAEHHLRHRAEAELNLIPLIDILSVLVAFLLVYSTEVEVIQNTKGIEIPAVDRRSASRARPWW